MEGYDLIKNKIIKVPMKYSDIKKSGRAVYHSLDDYYPDYRKHYGQRKLLLSEVQFLTNWVHKDALVIYAGAAPNIKGFLLARLFPNHRFVFIDPNRFRIRANRKEKKLIFKSSHETILNDIQEKGARIFIINECFTNDFAKLFEDKDVLFISDIRTRNEEDEFPSDICIINDLITQANWLYHMRPRASLLKFRLPYFYCEANEIEKYYEENTLLFNEFKQNFGVPLVSYQEKILYYFDSPIYLQSWAGIKSTETRMKVMREDIDKDFKQYDGIAYDEHLYFYNIIVRQHAFCFNIKTEVFIGHCCDCRKEIIIWESYINSGMEKDIRKIFRLVDKYIGGVPIHQCLFRLSDQKKLLYLSLKFNRDFYERKKKLQK